jgi:hypothetical protein
MEQRAYIFVRGMVLVDPEKDHFGGHVQLVVSKKGVAGYSEVPGPIIPTVIDNFSLSSVPNVQHSQLSVKVILNPINEPSPVCQWRFATRLLELLTTRPFCHVSSSMATSVRPSQLVAPLRLVQVSRGKLVKPTSRCVSHRPRLG